MFYTYIQNNSGGSFHINPGRGIDYYVIVEAESPQHADDRAEGIGIYFDPEYLIDCSCCGSRWSPADDWCEHETPTVYGGEGVDFDSDEVNTYVHYLDGTVRAGDGL